ncbi:MAG: DUF5693 family protein [Armatimonadota bacterium]
MTRRVLIAAVALGAIAAAVVLGLRSRVESKYRKVEIVLDGQDWVTLIRREGRDVAPVLRELRIRGATAIALPELTLKQLAEDGAITYGGGGTLQAMARVAQVGEPFRSLAAAGRLRSAAVYISGPPDALAFVAGRMRTLLGESRVRTLGGAIEVMGTTLDLEELGLGFRQADALQFMRAGFEIVVRPRNFRGLTPASLHALAESYAAVAPFPTIIFALTEVQGYEGLIDQAAAEYERIGALFGRIEVFSARRKQKGEDRLTALMRPEVVRVFSITPEELQVLRPDEVVDRFVRAAQERNLRVLYVRPLLFTPAGVPALTVNVDLVETISRRLQGSGYSLGRAGTLEPLAPPRPLTWLVALGAAALSVLVILDIARVLGLRPPAAVAAQGVLTVVAVTVAAGFTPFDGLWRQLLALGTAVAGAAGATVWAMPRESIRPAPMRAAFEGYATLLRALALAVVAGIFVAALLSQWAFMLAISTFLGVKAAHVIPIAVAGVWLVFLQRPPGGWRAAWREGAVWIGHPLRIGTALAVLVIAAAGVMLLARTGNISLPLAGVEQQLRTTLEDILVARPRTKEFLIGYPALVVAGMAWALRWRRTALAAALIGTIGTAGAINSFAHAHTPLLYTVWRTGNALLLGVIVALPAVLVLLWIGRRQTAS